MNHAVGCAERIVHFDGEPESAEQVWHAVLILLPWLHGEPSFYAPCSGCRRKAQGGAEGSRSVHSRCLARDVTGSCQSSVDTRP
jgi:hypothetical protein